MKYRKKPVVIEAFKWTGSSEQKEDPEWIVDAVRRGDARFLNEGTPNVQMVINTLEGPHIASQGDYVIKGIAGELYPCKPDIFTKTYERVED